MFLTGQAHGQTGPQPGGKPQVCEMRSFFLSVRTQPDSATSRRLRVFKSVLFMKCARGDCSDEIIKVNPSGVRAAPNFAILRKNTSC